MMPRFLTTICMRLLTTTVVMSGLWLTNAFAQTAMDQHGVVLPLDSIRFPSTVEEAQMRGGSGGDFCNASGIFNVYFWEVGNNTGTGFDDAVLGAARRDVVCRAFTDLSLMLQPADDPYLQQPNTQPFVNITMLGGGLPPGALAAAQVWHNTIALPDPDANPLNNITEALQRQGVLDGEVWRTINGGHDSWEAYEMAENICANYEHGRISVNFTNTFHLDPSTVSMAGYDLYRIILHEAIHLLGFYSHSTSVANSYFQTFLDPLTHSVYFSRFDIFLNDGTQSLVIDPLECNWSSNANSISTTTPCGVFFEGAWSTAPQPIFSPTSWMQGSSMSHLDNACAGGDFLMHWSTPPNDRLIPSQVEANILCDIGYHTTTQFGDAGSGWDEAHATLAACGTRLAGVDDIYADPTSETFYTMQQGTTITMSDFLDNDEDESLPGGSPTAYDCLTILQGGGALILAPTSFTYAPDPDFVGWAILRYVPLNSGQNRSGNLTYIYIEVRPEDICASQTCNIVNGGNFEHSALSTIENAPYHNWRIQCNNSPDLVVYDGVSGTWISEISTGGAWPWVDFFSCPNSSVVLPASHNGTPLNDQYMALVGTASGNPASSSENVMFELCRPLLPGQTYTLEYWIYGSGNCGHGVAFEASEFRPCNQAQTGTDVTGGINSCNGINFSTFDVKSPATAAPGWNLVTHTFLYAGTSPANWLMCYLANSGGGQNLFGSVFVDDVSIRPVIGLTATIVNACGTLPTGELHLAINGGYAPYTIQWSNGFTGLDNLNLASGSYDVTVTDDLGCSTLATFIVGSDPCAPFSISKSVTPSSGGTYAGAPVLFNITVCNSTANDEVVDLTEDFPPNFQITGSNPPLAWTTPSSTFSYPIPDGECVDFEIMGFFTTIGAYTNTATVEHLPTSTSLSAVVDIDVLEGCPLIVYGSGGCNLGEPVEVCLGVHTPLSDVTSITYYILYPDILIPPSPGPLTIGTVGTELTTPAAILPFITSATLGVPVVLGWAPPPYTGYKAVQVAVDFALPGISVSPPYELFCVQFSVDPLGAGVPSGYNTAWTWASTYPPPGFDNHVTATVGGAPIALWTQAYHILFSGCDVTAPDAQFTVDVPSCGGAVTVHGALSDPAAIHIWTWGDDRTTPTNGAQDWTYDYLSPFTVNQTPSVTLPPSSPGTYTITHTVILNGVSSSDTQTITIYECCPANVQIPDGALASSIGSSFTGTVGIHGQFIVDTDVLFLNAQVYMEAGAEIVVYNGVTLDLDNTSITACNGVMWRSITAQSGASVRVWDSYVDDAETAISGLDGSVIWVDNAQFHNNRVAIGIPDMSLPYNSVACWVSNSTIYSGGPMPQPYPGQSSTLGAIGYAAVDVHNTSLDFSGGNNIIHTLSNGVVGHGSDINVVGCQFVNIEPDAAYAYSGNGAGIYANGLSGWNTLKQQGYGTTSMPSFNGCRWGVYTEYMNVRSTDNRMLDMGTAYRVDRSGYREVDILNNKVFTHFHGMELRANDGAAHILVQDNEITFGDAQCTACRGFTAILVTEGNYVAPDSRILNNTIHFMNAPNSRFGIGLTSADDWVVAENNVLMASNAFNFSGIQMAGCRRTEVSCNSITGAGTAYPLDAQSAIRNLMGGEPLISCNEMDLTANGILFNGVAYNTDVRGNQFHNHNWPLHLDATAIVDAQTLKGNLWDPNATTPVWGAWYEVSAFQAALYQFLYDPAAIGSGTTTPPSYSPPGWFNVTSGPNYDCAEHHGSHYCSQFGGERCKDCLRELDEKIASDSLENDPYTYETTWMLGADLYKKLDDSPTLLDSLPELETFYNELQGSTTAAFKAIADDQLTLYALDSTVVAQLQANRNQIDALLALVKGGMQLLSDEALTPAQRQSILAGLSGYRQTINSLSAWNASALQLASGTKVLSAEGVRSSYATVTTSELIEINERTVNEVYLATVGKDVDMLTTAQAADLFDIANQCPMVGGNAVFKARSLYWLIDDSYNFDDQALCLQHGIIVKSLLAESVNRLKVVPNPASDGATLVLDRELDEPGTFVVYDAVGAEVMRQAVPIEMARITFSTASLAPALYHYQVRGPSGIIGVGKLTIVR